MSPGAQPATSLLDFSQRRQDGPFLNLPLPGFLFLGWWFLAKSDLFFCLFSFFFKADRVEGYKCPKKVHFPTCPAKETIKGDVCGTQ